MPGTRGSSPGLRILVALAAGFLGACHDGGEAEKRTAFWAGTKPIEVAQSRAHRGPWRMNESDFDYVDDPTVAIADDGHVGVAWVDQARRTVLFQMYTPAGRPRFPVPVPVSPERAIFSWLPRLVFAADDPQRVYALWQEIVFSGGSHGGQIFFARSTDGGATFGAPINLSNSPAGDGKGRLSAERWDNGSLDLPMGSDGQLYAAWTEYEGRLWVSRSIDGGATFSAPILMAGDARAPALEADGRGAVHLAWSAGDGTTADIRIATSRDGGRTFHPPLTIASRSHADAPKIAADRSGRLHLVYGERGTGGRYQIRYARRDAGGEGFSEPRTIETGPHGANFPDLAVDGADRLYVVWRLYPGGQRAGHGLGFTTSADHGRTFAPWEIVPDSDDPELGFSGSLQGSLMSRLAVNADGALALVNSTFAPGRASRIWLWRVSPPPSPPSPRP